MRIERGFPKGTIIEHSDRVVINSDTGEMTVEAEVVGSEDLIGQYQYGYRCLKCHGVQSAAFPEVCESKDVKGGSWACGYRMREFQAEDFARTRGEGYWGPTPLSAFDDEREREAWTPKTGILLPGKDF